MSHPGEIWQGPPDSSHPLPGTLGSEAEHGATAEMWISSGVNIIKYLENKTEFNIGDGITVVSRIINTQPDKGYLDNFYIEDEIPQNFKLIGQAKIVPDRDVNINFDNKTHKLTLTSISGDSLATETDLKYTLKANGSGNFIVGPTVLRAKRSGNEIEVQSDPIYISVINHPPRFKKWTVPYGIPLWKGDPLKAEAYITDIDNDSISCTLRSSLHGIINCSNGTYDKKYNVYCFSWDLSNYSGKQNLIFDASDNKENTTITAEIEIWEKLYGLPIPTVYWWTIPTASFSVILGELIILFLERNRLVILGGLIILERNRLVMWYGQISALINRRLKRGRFRPPKIPYYIVNED